jgi:predicted nucleotidyltransferase
MVSLNRAHLASEPLISLGRTRARLITRLTDELARCNGLAGAWLFGSAARGSGDHESDVDILLVAERSTEAASWAGSAAQIISDVHSDS